MKIECTVEELKELLKKETPVGDTTDVKINGKNITSFLDKSHNSELTNCDKPEDIQ